ncbi:MAG: sigma-70 family RNA polymerase sigma factor [Erysipelotrichaceae bacterium]|nr:sigma-70 family RNA polymerase sigma factor [Erysipelotrichaceae bacterium]
MKDTLYSLNDYELLYMVRTKDATALQLILQKYEQYMNYLMARYIEPDGISSKEDLQQECRILLLSLVESYREDQDCRFLTYLVNGVRNRIGNRNRVHQRSTKGIRFVSLDSCVNEDAGGSLIDLIDPKNAFYQPEYEWRYAELVEALRDMLMSLSEKEKMVWSLMNEKLTYEEAAQMMGITRKQFDNLRVRLKKKIVFTIMENRH